jgi:hypothetical protein
VKHDVGFTLCDQGTERLGLLGEEDKNVVNFGRMIEMFRQMREEEPEKVERISRTSATTSAPRSALRARPTGSPHTVAGTESHTSIVGPGPKGGFYFVNGSGAAEEVGTQKFLGRI